MIKVGILVLLVSSVAATNSWFDLAQVEEVDKRASTDPIKPESFHVLPFPDATLELDGGLVLAQFNDTLSTICLEIDQPNSGLNQYCDAADGSVAVAVPAEDYFKESNLDQFPILFQYEEKFYPVPYCKGLGKLAVICKKKSETTYYVGTYNAKTGEVNSNEGIVIVSAITDDDFDPEAMKHGPVYYSTTSSEDVDLICKSLGFSKGQRADPVPIFIEEYREFNEVFHKYTADFKVWSFDCPTDPSNIADCNIETAKIEDEDIEDTLFIECQADKPTPYTIHTPTPPTTGPFTTPEPRTDTNNEVDLEFGGVNLKLKVGPHHFRERF